MKTSPPAKVQELYDDTAGSYSDSDESDVVALRYTREEVVGWAETAGFLVDRCVVEPVEGMPMDALSLEGTRA